MTEPSLVPRDSLRNLDVGLSISDSADIGRLGLTAVHPQLAIAELGRAVLVAGGSLTYGGRIRPSGFTQFLMHEVRRYRGHDRALRICLAWQEHRKLSLKVLDDTERELGTYASLVCLSVGGKQIDYRTGRSETGIEAPDAATRIRSLTSLRAFMAQTTNARVLVGGKLGDFQGAMPGVVEEAITSVKAGQPLFVAGGFGGASAAVARTLSIEEYSWAPDDFPAVDDDRVASSLKELLGAVDEASWDPLDNGLTLEETRALAVSHRPGEIASLVVLGLSRWNAAR